LTEVSPKKVKAIDEIPQPMNLIQLRAFLGTVNYYEKFISKLSEMCFPLNHLLQKSVKWKWTAECKNSVKRIKNTLTSSEALVHWNPSLPLFLAADASSMGIGAVLFHRFQDGTEKAFTYAPKPSHPKELLSRSPCLDLWCT